MFVCVFDIETMDFNPFELLLGEEFSDVDPTSDEAAELLGETAADAATSSPPAHGSAQILASPTAAVAAAIEAKIAEAPDVFQTMYSSIDFNKNNDVVASLTPTLVPFPAPLLCKKPQPLFPQGLPSNFVSNRDPRPSGKPKGYFTQPPQGPAAPLSKDSAKPMPTSGNSNTKPTYATKTKSPPQKTRDLVQNILYVYSTKVSKKPLTPGGWGVVDGILLDKITSRDPNDPTLVRIANSGYDATHRCGFVACRDPASEAWVKSALHDSAYRAWSKGEQPEVRLCRVFLPARFDSLDDDVLIPLILRHNPALKDSTLSLQNIEAVQRGRAFIVEMDSTSYSYVKAKNHKLEFVMMDIDCQPYTPVAKKTSRVEGITKLGETNKGVTPSHAASTSRHSPSKGQQNTLPQPKSDNLSVPTNPLLNKSFTEKFNEERKKRNRTDADQLYQDAAKKKDAA